MVPPKKSYTGKAKRVTDPTHPDKRQESNRLSCSFVTDAQSNPSSTPLQESNEVSPSSVADDESNPSNTPRRTSPRTSNRKSNKLAEQALQAEKARKLASGREKSPIQNRNRRVT